MITSFKQLSSSAKWALAIGVALILGLVIWFGGVTKAWNSIGNRLFARQMNAKRAEVQKELDDAAAQKKVLEQTLLEYKQAKEELTAVKAEKDRLEKIFNDKSKAASEKVAEFKAALADDPVHTSTDNITTDDLCARAKAIGSSAATIAALCGQ